MNTLLISFLEGSLLRLSGPHERAAEREIGVLTVLYLVPLLILLRKPSHRVGGRPYGRGSRSFYGVLRKAIAGRVSKRRPKPKYCQSENSLHPAKILTLSFRR
jgi:hypothetical protein